MFAKERKIFTLHAAASALLAGITLQFGLCILLCIDDPELKSELYTVLGIVIVVFVLYTSIKLMVVERMVYYEQN